MKTAPQTELLQDPYSGDPLICENGYLVNPLNDEKYYIIGGIPVFLPENQMSGENLRYSRFYDRISRFFWFSTSVYCWLKGTTERKVKQNYLNLLEIHENDQVLEVASGSADNLIYLPDFANYSGIDISFGMLTMARRTLRLHKRKAALYQGEAEHLPFVDNFFNVVFHIGGINFFNDKQLAIQEMIRVAKPGSRLLIIDETEAMVVNAYQRNPISRKLNQLADRDLSVPVHLLPQGMKEIEVRYFFDQTIYCLTFRKPAGN